MQLHEAFDVAADPQAVWAQLIDIPSISRCLPGATLGERLAPDRYAGRMAVKLGPISAGFDGEATVRHDAAQSTATIEGRGLDRRGGSRGQVVMTYTLRPTAGGGTHVAVDAELTLAGPIAQFGRVGLVTEVSRRMIAAFVACLEAKLAAATPDQAAEIRAGELGARSIVLGSLGSSLKRGLGRDGG